MKIAFAILAHQDPDGLAELAEVLASQGDLVVIHYDAKSPAAEHQRLRDRVAGAARVRFAARLRCGWGEFSLVQASLNCLHVVEAAAFEPDYVYLLSGADLPIRPLAELRAYLRQRKGTEFIESFPIRERRWLLGGDEEERFLYRFPFNKRRNERLFRGFLLLQRWARIKKSVPPGLELSLGSQFWCLTWPACRSIRQLCRDRREILRFFRTAWIPDESFFQTLIRSVVPAQRIETKILTHYRFDERGRPLEYANGDQEGLQQIRAYFARKIAPEATQLRQHFYKIAVSGSDTGSVVPGPSSQRPP